MSRLVLGAAAFATVALSRAAGATDCSTLPGPIYVSGMPPAFLPVLAQTLASSNVTLVFDTTNDCAGIKSILPANAGGVPIRGLGATWDAQGNASSCDLPEAGLTADAAITGLLPATCAAALGITLPSNLETVLGPTIPYAFIAPAGAGAPAAISAEEAFYVFGYGYFGQIAPWDLGNQQMLNLFFAPGQATMDVTAGAIGLSTSSFVGTTVNGGQAMLTSLSSASPASSAIGTLSSDVYDGERAQVSPLAFRGYGQDFAWTPDSSGAPDGGFDKRNVREGRYVLAAAMHFLALTTDGGQAETSGGQTILDIADGASALIDLTETSIGDHLVPQCAMTYDRSVDGYDPTVHYGFVPSARTQSCDCYFDAQTSTTTCQTCTGSCPGSGVCRRNYCEAF